MTTYIAYLDEFGHVGPYLSRNDAKYKTSPVFGLGGIILPADTARKFSSWFHWFKKNIFLYEIDNSGIPSYHWEKKGSSLFTTHGNIKYKGNNYELLKLVLKKLSALGGHVIYNGMQKYLLPPLHKSNHLYLSMLSNILEKIHYYCENQNSNSIIILDENGGKSQRTRIVDMSALNIFGSKSYHALVEPVFQAESHLYQNLQCADWICAVLTRIFNYKTCTSEYPELCWTINEGFDYLIHKYQTNSYFSYNP